MLDKGQELWEATGIPTREALKHNNGLSQSSANQPLYVLTESIVFRII